MKYKERTKDCRLIVKAKTSFGESIHEKELDVFSSISLRGFLKPRVIRKNVIEYTGPVAISLAERMKKPTSKKDFYFILEQVIVAVRKLDAKDLPVCHLVKNLQNIYINEVTKEVQFLYVPLAVSADDDGVSRIIEEIVYSTIPAEEKDREFVSRFVYFFHSMKTFDIDRIEKYIAKEDQSVVNTIKKYSQSGFITDKQQHYYDHYPPEGTESDDDPTELLEEDNDNPTGFLSEEDEEATDRFSENPDEAKEDGDTELLDDEATGLLDEKEGKTGLLFENGPDGKTVDLKENNVPVHFPTLFRVLTQENISVNKPVFRLGKERSYVDYFVSNNDAVSRSHADIIIRGNRYFIRDLNSKNHTYVNGKELPVYCEIELNDGDDLKLANEKFVFHK